MPSVSGVTVALSVFAAPLTIAVSRAGLLFAVSVHPAIATVARTIHARSFRFAGARLKVLFFVETHFAGWKDAGSAGPFRAALAHSVGAVPVRDALTMSAAHESVYHGALSGTLLSSVLLRAGAGGAILAGSVVGANFSESFVSLLIVGALGQRAVLDKAPAMLAFAASLGRTGRARLAQSGVQIAVVVVRAPMVVTGRVVKLLAVGSSVSCIACARRDPVRAGAVSSTIAVILADVDGAVDPTTGVHTSPAGLAPAGFVPAALTVATALGLVTALEVVLYGTRAVLLGAVSSGETLGALALTKARVAGPLFLVGVALVWADVLAAVLSLPGRVAPAVGFPGCRWRACSMAGTWCAENGGLTSFTVGSSLLALWAGERHTTPTVDVREGTVLNGKHARPVAAAGVLAGDGKAQVGTLVDTVQVPVGLRYFLCATAARRLGAVFASVPKVAVAVSVDADAVLAPGVAGSAGAGLAVPA